ncbi:hypothetical protein AYR66_07005 [Noviherbaspirillum denitrificans]|uniref:Uncharacterized protein n=1 Tax=Noviherbaspirillum denitrificans TaxID=1968433 RepID=A0A254T9H8_9BURK|nr:hypothetical protein AYR66_07005 [Noviherbaspirillum denitrificans]
MQVGATSALMPTANLSAEQAGRDEGLDLLLALDDMALAQQQLAVRIIDIPRQGFPYHDVRHGDAPLIHACALR